MYRGLCHVTVRRVLQSALYNTRPFHLKGHPDYTGEAEDNKPLKFSTSKGSHRRWTVAQSFGSDYQRPWWKVLPVSLFLTAVLLWACFREETEIDEILYRPVSELLEGIDKGDKTNGNK
ncbi:ubiquinol-cytochrome-c reductase complex assembly factor 4 [Hyla sarda]|uniref:ubiquinol-cytochrome-c reductase complex assembly factor 4 n=1 Tax=Hyla sarda TaxID=327740 RepID=UPI0024C42D2E|nr:ubiquinol-cytochrome-c reductase complex assembly factor 4 [Hyla sarda]